MTSVSVLISFFVVIPFDYIVIILILFQLILERFIIRYFFSMCSVVTFHTVYILLSFYLSVQTYTYTAAEIKAAF